MPYCSLKFIPDNSDFKFSVREKASVTEAFFMVFKIDLSGICTDCREKGINGPMF